MSFYDYFCLIISLVFICLVRFLRSLSSSFISQSSTLKEAFDVSQRFLELSFAFKTSFQARILSQSNHIFSS